MKLNLDRSKKIMIVIICVQMLIIGFMLFRESQKEKYPRGRKYLEYALSADRFEVQIYDNNGNDITDKFIAANKQNYIDNDWDKIMENFEKQSGNMSIVDKYDR